MVDDGAKETGITVEGVYPPDRLPRPAGREAWPDAVSVYTGRLVEQVLKEWPDSEKKPSFIVALNDRVNTNAEKPYIPDTDQAIE